MSFYYYHKNGKLKKVKLPKNNDKPPKTKRLRKKKFWAKCGDCGVWFKTYSQNYGHRNDGKKVCQDCLINRFKKTN